MKDYPPPPPLKKKKKKKVLDQYLHHDLGMLPLLRCFFAHLLILQYPDHHQNLISSYLYYSGPVHKISSQSVHNFLSNVVHRQTDRQTNQRYQKHNLLCQGGKYHHHIISIVIIIIIIILITLLPLLEFILGISKVPLAATCVSVCTCVSVRYDTSGMQTKTRHPVI